LGRRRSCPANLLFAQKKPNCRKVINVAHSLSAKKRVRQNLKARARNRARKSDLRTQVKQFTVALTSGDVAKAEVELRKTTQALDKVAAKGTIHKNTASRKRSRLAKHLNAAKKGSGTPAAKA
jgi:small subunit ribosomal protein S20